jgi:hypothetical protein
MKPEELEQIRIGAELQNYAPYITDDLDKMKRGIVNRVMMLVDQGTFTPDIAFAKWHEYVSYERLSQRVNKKIVVGQELGNKMPQELK